MREEKPELTFSNRAKFRDWLTTNAATAEGVWLVFGKKGGPATLSAQDALEEALCYGWIDGQMQSVGDAKYLKYFARRRDKSVWSEKNKKLVENLREKGLVTPQGEEAVASAIRNGSWDAPKDEPLSESQIDGFAEKLKSNARAYENFCKMPPSVRRVYASRYYSFKTEDARQRDFDRIVLRLEQNLKPM